MPLFGQMSCQALSLYMNTFIVNAKVKTDYYPFTYCWEQERVMLNLPLFFLFLFWKVDMLGTQSHFMKHFGNFLRKYWRPGAWVKTQNLASMVPSTRADTPLAPFTVVSLQLQESQKPKQYSSFAEWGIAHSLLECQYSENFGCSISLKGTEYLGRLWGWP